MKNSFKFWKGCGDFLINDIAFLQDPCPLPDTEKKRTLDDRERLLYAPFSGVGGLIYDKDAVYIELGGSHSHSNSKKYSSHHQDSNSLAPTSNNIYLNNIIGSKNTVDSKLTSAKLKIFSNGDEIESSTKDFDNSKNGNNENDKEDDLNEEELEEGSEGEDEDIEDDECKLNYFFIKINFIVKYTLCFFEWIPNLTFILK